jgi:hypothetical protein
MKIIGILLILGALIGGGIILSDTIPGWMNDKDYVVRAKKEAADAIARVDRAKSVPIAENDDGHSFEYLVQQAESATSGIRSAEEGVERRRNETFMFGGGALVVLALGVFFVTRGRRAAAVAA